MTCSRCGRKLKRPTDTGMGPKCELAMLGRVTRRRKAAKQPSDARQVDLFAEVLG